MFRYTLEGVKGIHAHRTGEVKEAIQRAGGKHLIGALARSARGNPSRVTNARRGCRRDETVGGTGRGPPVREAHHGKEALDPKRPG